MKFVRFLEQSGHIETPGELEDNLRLLDAFLGGLCDGGYAAATINLYRVACTALIVWLHLSRICLCDLTLDVIARFKKRQFAPWIPGVFRGQEAWRPNTYATELRGFLRHLVAIGRIEAVEPASVAPTSPILLDRYAVWLENHRAIRPGSIRRHVWLIAEMMPELGDDPRAYDTALIRDVLHRNIQRRSRSYAPVLTSTMRMYLRFLASEARIQPGLVAAVPSAPRQRLSSLPRYIASDDVERAIATCSDNATGLRDRAILLLLARLALRAQDIVALRLADVDWDRARIRVSGKSRREAILPLPQDAGDALHAYIATARPKVDVDKVFLCTSPPWRGFGASNTVGSVARRALDRAGIKTFAGRGAHVFRHSQATTLLRSGATLDVIQSLLRPSVAEHDGDLRQDRCRHVAGNRSALDRRDRTMTTTIIDHIVRFLEINRSLGYRFEKNEEMLRSFARFAEARNETYVRSETAVEWASASRAASSTFQVTKLRAVRDFAAWLHAEDDRHEIPPRDALGPLNRRRPQPHLISVADIRKLLTAALSMPPAATIRPLTWHYLFGLIAATGLRTGEALGLTLDDITPDGLVIRGAKFGKTRAGRAAPDELGCVEHLPQGSAQGDDSGPAPVRDRNGPGSPPEIM